MTLVACRACGVKKQRIRKSRGKGNPAYFFDENGERWQGFLCKLCSRVYQRERHSAKVKARVVVKVNKFPIYVDPRSKLRECQSCGESTVNYYKCTDCIQKNELYNDDLTYTLVMSNEGAPC